MCHLATGDMLRALVGGGSPLGKKVKQVNINPKNLPPKMPQLSIIEGLSLYTFGYYHRIQSSFVY